VRSWRTERARPGGAEGESLRKPYPSEARVSSSATASGPRAFPLFAVRKSPRSI
jgi:hypothetical protein